MFGLRYSMFIVVYKCLLSSYMRVFINTNLMTSHWVTHQLVSHDFKRNILYINTNRSESVQMVQSTLLFPLCPPWWPWRVVFLGPLLLIRTLFPRGVPRFAVASRNCLNVWTQSVFYNEDSVAFICSTQQPVSFTYHWPMSHLCYCHCIHLSLCPSDFMFVNINYAIWLVERILRAKIVFTLLPPQYWTPIKTFETSDDVIVNQSRFAKHK